MLSSASNRVPMMVYPLINGACQGARRLPNSTRPHTFQIIVNGKSLQLAAPDEYVASEWLQALIHAANGVSFPSNFATQYSHYIMILFQTHYKDKLITQSCSLLMTTEHILTVREAFPCTVQSLFSDDLEQELINGPQALSCASILDLVSFRLPSAEQSWCILVSLSFLYACSLSLKRNFSRNLHVGKCMSVEGIGSYILLPMPNWKTSSQL